MESPESHLLKLLIEYGVIIATLQPVSLNHGSQGIYRSQQEKNALVEDRSPLL